MLKAACLAIALSLGAAGDCAAQVPQLTKDQQDALAAALKLPPGTTFQIQHTTTSDLGSMKVDESAEGQGARLRASGEKEVDIGKFNSSAPGASLGGGKSATGTDLEADVTTKGGQNLWANPLLWVGILLVLAAGVVRMIPIPPPMRVTIILAVLGGAFICAAFFPGIMLFIVAGAIVVLAGPYLFEAVKGNIHKIAATDNREALRAVAAGISDLAEPAKGGDTDLYEKVKAFIRSHASEEDKAVIKDLKKADGLNE